ncbi:MAG: molybdopterin-dependent oxidoreductase [Nitrososphaeria archaeon]|nr:molybdopterin-dependent oxidoreductase [Nitrososphaeria archaeon]
MRQQQNVESIPAYWKRHGYPLASDTSFSMLAIKTILEEKPYPIKAAVISLQNIVAHIPDDDSVVKALEKLEFIVVLDVMWSETCKYADVILPVPFFFESTSATLIGVSKSPIGQISIAMKAVDPPKHVDVKTQSQIVYELTKRLFPEIKGGERLLDPQEIWIRQCEAIGANFDELMEYGTLALYDGPDYSPLTDNQSLPTETGEIELLNLTALDRFSEFIDKPHNLNPFPTWIQPSWMEKELEPDEFIPVEYMHSLTAINTWARDSKLLLEVIKWEGADNVLIHEERARQLGIKSGDLVEVVNPITGDSIRVRVSTTDLISSEVIAGVHGLNPGRHEGGQVNFTYIPRTGINSNFISQLQLVEGIACSALQDFHVKIKKVGT